MSNKVGIENESGNKYFHIMLNISDDDLDVYEYRLLGHYIRICNVYGTGKCWESTRTTSTKCKMSVGKVSSTRIALEKKGYLKLVQPKDNSKADTLMVLVVDKWADNIARYSNSHDEQTTGKDNERSPHERPRSSHETIKNKLERKKDSASKNDATSIKEKKLKPAEHLGIAFGVMPIVRTDWSLYTKTCNVLKEAGIKPDEYLQYIEWVRNQSRKESNWTVSVPSLIAKGRISTYIQEKVVPLKNRVVIPIPKFDVTPEEKNAAIDVFKNKPVFGATS